MVCEIILLFFSMLVRKIKEKGKKGRFLPHFLGEIHSFLWFVPEL